MEEITLGSEGFDEELQRGRFVQSVFFYAKRKDNRLFYSFWHQIIPFLIKYIIRKYEGEFSWNHITI